MRIFSSLYAKIMNWSRHRHAPYYLYSLSFAESSFFPIPPDLMLAPMALARPEAAWTYALLTTVASVLGGVLGYLIGMLAFDFVHPYIIQLGYESSYQQIVQAFASWNFWVMLVAGFAPIPYKLFTIAAGATHIALLPFILGSLLGRGGRFFLVALLIRWGGERMEQMLMRYIDWLGWIFVVILAAILAVSLTGCSSFKPPAPVAEGWHQHLRAPIIYVVKLNDTLYSIARNHGLDYHRVASENNIQAPAYKIEPGQKLKLTPEAFSEAPPVSAPSVDVTIAHAPAIVSTLVTAEIKEKEVGPQIFSVKTTKRANIDWAWPVLEKNKLVAHFAARSLNKGIDISGKKGSPVIAAASGRVVYAGSGLHGYGLLIIIRHNNEYLSAYAHNEKLLAEEGQQVKVGQMIATMGDADAKGAILHFEIRRGGKPVNPLNYLPFIYKL